MRSLDHDLFAALRRGDPRSVASLLRAGADPRYRREHGYDAVIDAVYGGGTHADLLEVLRQLIAAGAPLDGETTYRESGLRALSARGNFAAVRLLLDAGADEGQLAWTPLIRAVALGSAAEVERLAAEGDLEARDSCSRTAWLVALLVGDLDKARILLDRGADRDARSWSGRPPLHHAIDGGVEVVRWLLELGQDVEQADDSGITALMAAVSSEQLAPVELVLAAGADVHRRTQHPPAVGWARTGPMARRLLAAGADPLDLDRQGIRALVGLPPDEAPDLLDVTTDDFRREHTRTFGSANPQRMRMPFWEAMIRSGINAYQAAQKLGEGREPGRPVWCAQRFGQTMTILGDGRIVQIGGEHEDYYDPDFCIYNDVFVHEPDGAIAIHGYPEAVFPPTDFHTATLVGEAIWVIGSLGYHGTRRPGETPVYRLELATFRMERVPIEGEAPGWIYKHRAELTAPGQIRVSGGKVVRVRDGKEVHEGNEEAFVLELAHGRWSRAARS